MIHIKLHFELLGSKDIASQVDKSCSYQSRSAGCTGGWYITGYFTPLEYEYDFRVIRTRTIDVHGHGRATLNSAFLKDVAIEGFGKTREGWYIGYSSLVPHWFATKIPLDALGNELVSGQTVAVDTKIIPFKSKIRIPSLPSPWKTKIFIATDIGGAIKDKHIDVYTGEGHFAKSETFRITGENNIVCLQKQHR